MELPNRGITLIHGHRHSWEYHEQGMFFNRSASHWLVSSSDLLLIVNANESASERHRLLQQLQYYPHQGKAIALPPNRGGFRCGHLHAIEDTAYAWQNKSFALFLHPDVFLHPLAFSNFGDFMHLHRHAAIFVTRYGGSPIAFDTDLFVFRPLLLSGTNVVHTWCRCGSSCGKPRGQPSATPERQLAASLRASPVTRVEMCTRFSASRRQDSLGVQHAHSRSQLQSTRPTINQTGLPPCTVFVGTTSEVVLVSGPNITAALAPPAPPPLMPMLALR